jgi:hypothetical protein
LLTFVKVHIIRNGVMILGLRDSQSVYKCLLMKLLIVRQLPNNGTSFAFFN